MVYRTSTFIKEIFNKYKLQNQVNSNTFIFPFVNLLIGVYSQLFNTLIFYGLKPYCIDHLPMLGLYCIDDLAYFGTMVWNLIALLT